MKSLFSETTELEQFLAQRSRRVLAETIKNFDTSSPQAEAIKNFDKSGPQLVLCFLPGCTEQAEWLKTSSKNSRVDSAEEDKRWEVFTAIIKSIGLRPAIDWFRCNCGALLVDDDDPCELYRRA